jgi:hypothetical protein
MLGYRADPAGEGMMFPHILMMPHIFSGFMFLGALAAYAQYFFGWPVGTAGNAPTLQLAIFATVFAFLLSPGGLPTFTAWLVDKLDDLNCAIKSI